MKKSIVSVSSAVLVLVAVTGSCASGAGEENMRLPEDVVPQLKPLLTQAMQQSPKMLERNLDLALAEADGYVARASSLPIAGGYLSYQKQQEKQVGITTSGTGDRFYYNASIVQPVWQWGILEATRKMSRIDRELAKANFGEAYKALAAEVRAAYLALVLQKMGLRNAELSFRLARENMTRQQARYSAHQVTQGEIMTHQLRVDEASLAMRRTKSDLEFALGNFRSLCGEISLTETDIPDAIGDITEAPVVGPVVADGAVDNSELVQMAEREVEKAKLARVAPRYGLFPRLAVMLGVSRDENNRDFIVRNVTENKDEIVPNRYQVDTVYAGAQVSWTIFDGNANRGYRLAALTRLRRAEQKVVNLRQSVARNLVRDRDNVTFTWDAYQVAQMRLRMARETLAHQRDEAARGQVSQEQIDTAQSNMFAFEYLAQSALAGHLSATVQYLSAKGLDPVVSSAVQH